MGKHTPVVADMNRSLAKVRDRIVGYLKRWHRLHKCERQHWACKCATMAKSQLMSILQLCPHEHIHGYMVKERTN